MSTPEDVYDLKSVKLPYLSGRPLKVICLIFRKFCRWGGHQKPARQRGHHLAALTAVRRAAHLYTPGSPRRPTRRYQRHPPHRTPAIRSAHHARFPFPYRHGFCDGVPRRAKPHQLTVAQRILSAIKAADSADPPLRAFIAVNEADVMKQAEAATQRFREKRPLSLFDGVPVAVKDELDMVPYPTTVGTRFLGTSPAAQDATVVARMRAAGALLIGKTNMHEIGIGVTGSESASRHAAQSLPTGSLYRRQFKWFSNGRCRRIVSRCHWRRWRRFDSHSGGVLRRGRSQSNLWSRQ